MPVGNAPARGPADALITIVELSDFTCAFCGRAQATLAELERLYPGQLRMVYRHNPLDMDDAYNAAITKIMVVPIQNYGGYSYYSNFQLQQFQNDVMRTLAHNINDNFVRFYSEWDLQNKALEPDQVLEMNLGRVRIGQPNDVRSTREVSKEVVIKETVYKPDSVVKQYATVRAKITNTRRTLLSEADLYMTMRDIRGRIVWNDRFTGQHRWQTEFATYTGDERALNESDRAQLNKNPNQHIPSEDRIMEELYRQIQLDLSNRLRGYFARF